MCLRLTANDGVNAPVFDEVTIVVPPPTLLYFSTLGNVDVGGLGSADDADIYAWKGGTTYSRVFDASANGVPAAADVDALVVEDSDTFYVSFLAATTLPGVGAVASQDVVRFDAGTWSMFFDGSDVGLTAARGERRRLRDPERHGGRGLDDRKPGRSGHHRGGGRGSAPVHRRKLRATTRCAPGASTSRGATSASRPGRRTSTVRRSSAATLSEHHRATSRPYTRAPARLSLSARTRTSSRATAAPVERRPRARASRCSSTEAPTASPTTSTRSTGPRYDPRRRAGMATPGHPHPKGPTGGLSVWPRWSASRWRPALPPGCSRRSSRAARSRATTGPRPRRSPRSRRRRESSSSGVAVTGGAASSTCATE